MPELIYCAHRSVKFASVALKHNFTYGSQMPRKVHYQPEFIDQDWKKPDRTRYMLKLKEHSPRMATVMDLEVEGQFEEVMSWAQEASNYVKESVIIIPKVVGAISKIPTYLNGKKVILGYSVPSSYGATTVPVEEFLGREVHLLGGSPKKQIKLSKEMRVVSADANYHQRLASMGIVLTATSHPLISDLWQLSEDKSLIPYRAFELSCINIKSMWAGSKATLRWALEKDLDEIIRVSRQYRNELGYVRKVSLQESIVRGNLIVALVEGSVVGFVNYRACKDGWNTIYELAVDKHYRGQHIGKGLLHSVPTPTRLKTTVDNFNAQEFYISCGFELSKIEEGRVRSLLVFKKAKPYAT